MVKFNKNEKFKFINLKINPIIFSAILCVILIYSGIIPLRTKNKLNSLSSEKLITEITGTIKSNPTKTSNKKYYSADFNVTNVKSKNGLSSSATGNVKLFIPSEIAEAYLPGKLYTAKKALNATICEQGIKLKASGNFQNGMFFAKNIFRLNQNKIFIDKFFYFRALMRLYFRRIMFTWGAPGGLLLALLSGIKEYTEDNVSINFRNAGLSHILALSGMHLNLFSNLAKKTGNLFFSKKISAFLQFIAICIFSFFAGFSPSLFRAFLCACLSFLIAALKIKNVNMIFILSTSFLIHSTLKPDDIFHPAFMLSYSALAGILFFSEILKFFFIKKIPEKIASSFCASTSAQFFTSPISLHLMGTFAPIGIIATMFVSPIITIFIYSGLLLIILCILFPFLVPFGAFLMKIIYNFINILVSFFAKIPYFEINYP